MRRPVVAQRRRVAGQQGNHRAAGILVQVVLGWMELCLQAYSQNVKQSQPRGEESGVTIAILRPTRAQPSVGRYGLANSE